MKNETKAQLAFGGAALAGAVLLVLLVRGPGWGFGGSSGSSCPARIRLDSKGLFLGGKPSSRAEAVAAAAACGSAVLTVTGDSNFGEWNALRADLAAAGVVWKCDPPRPGCHDVVP